jgi:hypothetical protein
MIRVSVRVNAYLGGTWLAWLSGNGGSPDSRFFKSQVPYLRLDGAVVAANWTALTDGTLTNPIDDPTYANQRRAAALLTEIDERLTRHPGALYRSIHQPSRPVPPATRAERRDFISVSVLLQQQAQSFVLVLDSSRISVNPWIMEKFSSQMEAETLAALRRYAEEENRSMSRVLTDAVRLYLETVRVRPAFRSAVEETLRDHDELLRRLS